MLRLTVGIVYPVPYCKDTGLVYSYKTRLNKYPEKIINNVIVPKNTPIRRHFITFLRSVASGKDNPTTAIIKAKAVPTGIPLATKTSITGTIPAALAYMGTANITERGTAYQLLFDIYCSKNPSGT